MLEREGELVTFDAAGTQTAIAAKIIDTGGDYFLAANGDLRKFRDALAEHFLCEEREETRVAHCDACLKEVVARTRRASPRLVSVHAVDTAERWQGTKTLARVEATRVVKGEQSLDNRFYISSRILSASDALDAGRVRRTTTDRRVACRRPHSNSTAERGVRSYLADSAGLSQRTPLARSAKDG